jgi:kynurenine formamidase
VRRHAGTPAPRAIAAMSARPAGERAAVHRDGAVLRQRLVQRDRERARVDRVGRRRVVIRLVGGTGSPVRALALVPA